MQSGNVWPTHSANQHVYYMCYINMWSQPTIMYSLPCHSYDDLKFKKSPLGIHKASVS